MFALDTAKGRYNSVQPPRPSELIMPEPLAGVTRVLDALNCGAVLLDRSGRILHVNRRICEMMGWAKEALEGKSVVQLYEGTGAEPEVREALRHFDEPAEKE